MVSLRAASLGSSIRRNVSAAPDITTVAGGPGGPDPGRNVALSNVCGVAYGDGGVYIGDEATVKRMRPGAALVTSQAGNGAYGFEPASPAGTPARALVEQVFDEGGRLGS